MTTGATRDFDWQAAYARLERAQEALGPNATTQQERVKHILHERARKFAQPLTDGSGHDQEQPNALAWTTAGQRYAVPIENALEVASPAPLIAVPGTPRFIRGVLHHRGRVLPVLDLDRLFGTDTHTTESEYVMVIVRPANMLYGILADTVEGNAWVDMRALKDSPGIAGERRAVVAGITSDATVVLDAGALGREIDRVANDHAA